MLQYDTLEQARFRLNETVITKSESGSGPAGAYYVQQINRRGNGPMVMSLTRLPLHRRVPEDKLGETILVPQDDVTLNFRDFALGYGNDTVRKRCTYYTRGTFRQQHQGLTYGMIDGMNAAFFLSENMEDLLFGRYPTVDEAFKRINEDGWTSCAVSRQFAVGRGTPATLRTLLYRGRTVGVAVGKTFKHFLIDAENEYLAEALQEAGFPFEVDK